jgi:LysR family nitrogen assimilation transcriptional regulator
MHLRTLRYFAAVAEAGSLTAAAAAIPIAQPALTRQMRDLETELGVTLLERMPRGVRLTPSGLMVYESAQRMLSEATRMRQRLAHKQPFNKKPVVIGASPTLARLLLPSLFENCTKLMEGITLRTREAFTPALLEFLERGTIDMAVVTNPRAGRGISLHPLLAEPIALISHARMKIRPVVTLGQLDRIPLLMTSLHRELVEQQLLSLGKTLNVHAEIDSVDSIRELVLGGRWATIMPVSVFKDTSAGGLPIQMSEISGVQLHRQLVLATRLDPRSNPTLSLMQELIESEFVRLADRGTFSFGTFNKGDAL